MFIHQIFGPIVNGQIVLHLADELAEAENFHLVFHIF